MQEAVYRSVKRACYAGLDPVALRTEIARRIRPAIPYDAQAFATHDPDTGLMTHVVREAIPDAFAREFVERLYPLHTAVIMIDAARGGAPHVAFSAEVPEFAEALRASGLRHEFNAILTEGAALWGSWCMIRQAGTEVPRSAEVELLRRLTPHIVRGLQRAALVERSRSADALAAGNAPGVLVLDEAGRVMLRSGPTAALLADLADVGAGAPLLDALPTALLSAAARVRLRDPCGDGIPAEVVLHVRGLSGRWYTVRASLAEPDAAGRASTVVVVQPIAPREMAPILARLYDLSAREREIIAGLARGESTKCIASRLRLSPHTVEEHVERACAKIGVRGRKALIARLFFSGYAPSNLAGPR